MPERSAPYEPPANRKLTSSDNESTNHSLFEWASRMFGVSLGFIYLVGFLVVMRHLSRYGVSTFSVFQLQYLVAGGWVIAPVVLMVFMQKASQRFASHALSVHSEGEAVSWRRRAAVASVTNIPGILLTAALAVFVGNVQGFTFGMVASLYVFYLALVFSADLLWVSRRTSTSTGQTWWANPNAWPFYATLLISVFLAYVFFFAIRVYPLIPYSLGGGKPLTVVFLLGEKESPDILVRNGSSNRSLPYKLVAATDKTFVVLSPDSRQESIEFNRDAVLGLVVLKESSNQ